MSALASRKSLVTLATIACLALLYLFGAAAIDNAPTTAVKDVLAGYAYPFDCMVVLPALFYLLVIRRNGLSPLFVLPVMWAGAALAAFFARESDTAAIALFGALAVAAEITIATREIVRFAQAVVAAKKTSSEAHAWFYPPLVQMTKNPRVSKLAANEFAMIYYALFSWRRTAPSDDASFSYHKTGGYSSFIVGMMLVIPIEMLVMHMLVSQFSHLAAWALTLASAYAVLWIIADCRASILCPISLNGSVLQVRSGMRFSADVPLDAVTAFAARVPGEIDKAKSVNLGMMGDPSGWLVLSKPMEVRTFFGSRKTVEAIGIAVDDKARFSQLLDKAIGERDETPQKTATAF